MFNLLLFCTNFDVIIDTLPDPTVSTAASVSTATSTVTMSSISLAGIFLLAAACILVIAATGLGIYFITKHKKNRKK